MNQLDPQQVSILEYNNTRIRPNSKSKQAEIVREQIERAVSDPSSIEWYFQARRDYGPSFGYADAREWWDQKVRNFPELFEGEDAIPVPAFVAQASAPVVKLPEPAVVRGRLMNARFAGTCKACGRAIAVGEPIDYVKGSGAFHPEGDERCKPVEVAPAAPVEENPADAWIREYKGTSPFFAGLRDRVVGGRALTDKQRPYVEAEIAKQAARDESVIKSTGEAKAAISSDGMYRNPDSGEIFKVQVAVHGSGNLYAKKLVVESDAVRDADGKIVEPGIVRFEFAKGAVAKLRPEWKMTLDEAKAFGALYGTCCVCGRTLTDEGSITAGIGPICAGKEWA